MTFGLLCGLLGFVPRSLAQEEWTGISAQHAFDLLQQANSWYYKNETWAMKIRLTTYAGHESTVVEDESVNLVKRFKTSWYSSVMDVHTIQDDKTKITVDSMEKVMLISSSDKRSSVIPMDTLSMALLKSCASIKLKKLADGQVMVLQFRKNPLYDTMEITIGSDKRFKKLKLFLSVAQPLNPDDEDSPKAKPRLEMTFMEYRTNIAYNEKEFNVSAYIRMDGNTVSTTSAYSQFDLKDTRYKY
ncbi:MAG: hypothetical protein ACHQFW_01985 [Chitinophagales bacterium]